MKHVATMEIERDVWEAIQASFHVDLREDEEGYDEEIINKYDFRAGTLRAGFSFLFEDGTEIAVGWYIEEFGGIVEWGDVNNCETLSNDYELCLETEFDGSTEQDNDCKYICKFIIKD